MDLRRTLAGLGSAPRTFAVLLSAVVPAPAIAGPADQPFPLSLGNNLFARYAADEGAPALGLGDGVLVRQGWTSAAELGWHLVPGTTISLIAGADITEREAAPRQDPLAAGAESHRSFVSLRARHVFSVDAFRLVPSSTLQFVREAPDRDAADYGGFTLERDNYGRLTGEIEAGYTVAFGGSALDLYASVSGEWDFAHPEPTTEVRAGLLYGFAVDGEIAAGITFSDHSGVTTSLELSNGLLGPNGLDDTAMVATIAIEF